MTLEQFFQEHPRCALAFSGGVDSAFLLWAAKEYGREVRAYYVKSAFQPEFEYADAVRLAGEVGAELTVIDADILAVEGAAANGPDRCYHCKRTLFTLLRQRSGEDGYALLLDGTNASDDAGDRPGMRALRELEVRSPLRECGLTKEEVRRRSKEAGLFTWNKPAYACLATRVPTGTPITAQVLEQIEGAEDALSRLGFADFRVRLLGDKARLQVTGDQMELALVRRGEIMDGLKPYFSEVLLDLEPRKASLQEEIGWTANRIF